MKRTADFKEQVVTLAGRLPEDKLQSAVDFLTYLQDREAWEATWELTSDPKVMASLRRSQEDIRKGRVTAWREVKR